MSQAAELLASLEEYYPTHDHSVADPDNYFVIDPDTRQISNLSNSVNVLMQNDHNSEVYTFEIPRFVEGHDMLKCDRVRLHYINAGRTAGNTHRDVYEMSDLKVNPRDAGTLISTWTIKRQATQYVGTLSFVIQYLCIDSAITEEGVDNISYEWHTDIYKNIEIRETINNSEEAIIDHTDILEEWYQLLFGTEDSLVARVVEASEAQKAAIELKGEETLATIPEDYSTTYNMAEEALRKKANAIEQTAEGEAIFINDSADAYLLGMNLYGKTTQVTTTGAQMFDRNSAVIGLLETDGTITTDGAYLTSDYIPVTPNTTYCQTRKDSIRAKFYDANKVALSDTWDTQLTGAGTFTTPANAHYLRTTVSVKVIDVFMLNEGKINLPYEPYSGRLVSPCPEYPQDLASVGTDETLVSIFGSNLIDATKLNVYANTSLSVSTDGYTITATGGSKNAYCSSTLSLTHLVEGLRGKKVYFAHDRMTQTDASSKCGPQINIKRTAVTDYIALSSTNLIQEVTIPEDVVDLSIGIYTNNTGAALATDNTLVSRGLRLSLAKCDWESYRQLSEIQFASFELPGIPVSQNGNYIDANGQHWCCDELDFERGVHVQRISEKVLDGTIGYQEAGTQVTGSYTAFVSFVDIHPEVGDTYMSDKFRCYPEAEYKTSLAEGVYVNPSENARNLIILRISNERGVTDMASFRAWMTSNPVTVLCPLKTPIETPLTNEEITLYKRLKTNYHNTTVVNDAGAHMAIKYSTDTKMFFENHSIATDAQVENAVNAYLTNYFANAEGVSF